MTPPIGTSSSTVPPVQELRHWPPHPKHSTIPSSAVPPPNKGPPHPKNSISASSDPFVPPSQTPPQGNRTPTAGGRALGVSPPVVVPPPLGPRVPPTCATAPDGTGTKGAESPQPGAGGCGIFRAGFLAVRSRHAGGGRSALRGTLGRGGAGGVEDDPGLSAV